MEDFIDRFLNLCYRFPLKDIPCLGEWLHHLILSNEKDLEANQSEFLYNDHSQFDLVLHENSENLEVEENQSCLTTFSL